MKLQNWFAFLLTFTIGITVGAQYRFVYSLDFKIDSTKRNQVQQEIFNLDYINGESIFYGQNFAKLDSIISVGGSGNRQNIALPKLGYIVTKNLPKKTLQFAEPIGLTGYLVDEPRQIRWKLLSDTKEVDKHSLQKATADFAGRHWTAWFAKDIQVADGPYKFSGLPGLIYSLADDAGDYIFELRAIEKIDKLYNIKSFEKLGIKVVSVDYKKFSDRKTKFEKHPEQFYYDFANAAGLELSAHDIRTLADVASKKQKANNNPIELSAE
ncbi:MAG: GLPGLI family protein [Chryseobacterium sp.]|nr:MAG: GLPGLI family protein [Chryseobacterium sp.]